jgi:uncharacterized membrane protein
MSSFRLIHPMIVHFPIALLTVSFLFEAAGTICHKDALRTVADWNWGLGVLGAAAAVVTGAWAAGHTPHSDAAKDILDIHETMGWSVLICGAAILAWKLWAKPVWHERFDPFVLLFQIFVLGAMVFGAGLGGRLVYEFAVGTPPAPALQTVFYGQPHVLKPPIRTAKPTAPRRLGKRVQSRTQVD